MILLTEAARVNGENEVLWTSIEEILVVVKAFSNTNLTENNFCEKEGRFQLPALPNKTGLLVLELEFMITFQNFKLLLKFKIKKRNNKYLKNIRNIIIFNGCWYD